MKLIYCNACNKKYTKYYINSHLKSLKHLSKSGCEIEKVGENLEKGLKFVKKDVILIFN
jgi:hypothetical protein